MRELLDDIKELLVILKSRKDIFLMFKNELVRNLNIFIDKMI